MSNYDSEIGKNDNNIQQRKDKVLPTAVHNVMSIIQ